VVAEAGAEVVVVAVEEAVEEAVAEVVQAQAVPLTQGK
jgi:hypothetical protein